MTALRPERPAPEPMPPLGLVPRFIRDGQGGLSAPHRLQEVDAAIGRYVAALYPIPSEWLDERTALLQEIR